VYNTMQYAYVEVCLIR